MKYPAAAYAKAFAELSAVVRTEAEATRITKNLVELAVKNGDQKELKKILSAADKMLREKHGINKFTFESARPLSAPLKKKLLAMAGAKDVVEEKVDPELVAGVRVTLNDERQFDASLSNKLRKMFT